jgi:hypothetical protein
MRICAPSIEEPECGAEPPVIDEFDDGEQIVEPVLERRAREHEREWRSQAFHRLRRLRRPVLDALAFVQNDEVPLRALDGKNVAQHLLIVADREKAVVPVLAGPLCCASENDLAVPFREAKNFAAPLGPLSRRRRPVLQHCLVSVECERHSLWIRSTDRFCSSLR